MVASVAEHRLSGLRAAVAWPWATEHRLQWLWPTGLVAPDMWDLPGPEIEPVPCTCRRILIHCTTGQVQRTTFKLGNPFHISALADITIVIIQKDLIFLFICT